MTKVVQSLYSGLGGHASVVFSLLDTDFIDESDNVLVFFGIEEILESHKKKSIDLNIKYFSLLKKSKQYLKPFNNFKKILIEENPDVIIIHGSELIFPAIKFSKRKTTKVIYVEHEPNHTKTILEKLQTYYALKYANTVICLNNIYKTQLESKLNSNTIINVIPNGIDVNKFCPIKKRSEIKTIGMAARLTNTKDHKNLIYAFSTLLKSNPDIQLKIAGTGNLEDKMKNYVSELNITNSVQFLGLLNEMEMIDFYQNIDLYVHATYSETLSTSILQAMSCGLIVITSDIENNKSLIEDSKDGLLYKDGNPDSLFSIINKVVNSYNKYSYLEKNARRKIEKYYSNKIMANGYKKLLAL